MRILLIFLSVGQFAFGQNLEIETSIDKFDYLEYEGSISDYKIKMYLEIGPSCSNDKFPSSWGNRKLTGWYYYINQEKRIPLIGYLNGSDAFYSFKMRNDSLSLDYHHVELFVPQNYSFDTLNQDCKMENYSERFIQDGGIDFSDMNWMNSDKMLGAKLELVHPRDVNTIAKGFVKFNGVVIHEINFSRIFDLSHIEKINKVIIKEHEGKIYMTISFMEKSVPGGSGAGQCGSGVEAYYGYLVYNKSWNIVDQELVLWHSCAKNINWDIDYKILNDKPELGIIKTNRP